MILYPAVDIRDGRAVRLEQGDFEREKIYDEDPVTAAKHWLQEGADHLHIVDLDGARRGRPLNLLKVSEVVRAAKEADAQVQVGGGLRTATDMALLLHTGTDRIILGSVAFSDADVVERALESHGEQVVVSIDADSGVVKVKGWEDSDELSVEDAFKMVGKLGVRNYIFTSIGRDGTMQGPDLDEIKKVGETVEGSFMYAGGIGSLEHLEEISSLAVTSLEGVVVGKALYERKFTVSQAQQALEGS